MFNDKIKLRLSKFVKNILENDAQAFGFIKENDHPNFNRLLNKLIPSLVAGKKSRRKEINDFIEEIIQGTTSNEIKKIMGEINALYERLLFNDADLIKLTEEIWLRPSKENEALFDEIEDSETEITSTTTSLYIRELLNEYSRFPQYKRERLIFSDELDLILTARETKQILCFRYKNEAYKVFVIEQLYTYTYDHANYVVCYDIERKCVCSFFLCDLSRLYLLKRKHAPTAEQRRVAQKYINEQRWINRDFVEVVENEE